MSQEQDEERICSWVCDAAISMLGASFASIILTPTKDDRSLAVYGKMGDASLPNGSFEGFQDLYNSCGGEGNLIVLAAAPQERPFMTVVLAKLRSEIDIEA